MKRGGPSSPAYSLIDNTRTASSHDVDSSAMAPPDPVPPKQATPLELHSANDLVELFNPLEPVQVPTTADLESGQHPAAARSPFVPRNATSMRWGYVISAVVPLTLLVLFLVLIFGSSATRSDESGSKGTVFLLSFSDALTAVSYFFIPGAIWTVVLKREDVDRNMWTLWMFGAFIICCGLTHLISAMCVVWHLEWMQVGMKIFTAGISYSTAIAVYKLIPLALAIPSPIALEKEVLKRKKAQHKLKNQWKRSCVLSRVTEEVRKNLKLQDICNATAVQCAYAFRADACSVYRYEPLSGKEFQLNQRGIVGTGETAKGKDRESDNDLGPYCLMSLYDRRRDKHILNRKEGETIEKPPLDLLQSLLPDNKAKVIDLHTSSVVTATSISSSSIRVDDTLIQHFRDHGTQAILCIAVPYRPDSRIVIMLERRDEPLWERKHIWGKDDASLLEEVSAQVAIGLEHAHLLREANKGRKLAIRNLALERAKEKAEQSSKAKSDFLATVSHEIRTPMNAICGMSKVLKGSHMSREQRECVQIISSSAKALLSLLNNILDFSKIEAGKTEIYQCPFDLYKCIQNLMGLMANYTTGKQSQVTLSTLIDPSVASVVIGDKQHLRQVLINLLSNALKFTTEGSITLKVNTNSTWETENETWAELQFDVIDTGIGIPREKQHRLFHPFSQVDSSATRKYEGTGLGLVISKRLCELMGGKMTIQSEEGKGSQFTFTIKVKLQGTVPDYGVCDQLKHNDRRNEARLQAEQLLPEVLPKPSVISSTPDTTTLFGASAGPTSSSSSSSASASSSSASEPSDVHSVSLYNNLPQESRRHMHPQHTHSLPTRLRPIMLLAQPESPRLPGTQYYAPPELMTPRRHSIAPQASEDFSDEHPVFGKILLAEDNNINQKVACKLLSRIGYTNITVVDNGKKAVEAVRQAYQEKSSFAIIIMDLHMPEMDGITASRIIKTDQQRWHPPPYIVACTADLQHGTRQACFKAGIDDFLEKPVKLKELTRVLLRAQRIVAQAVETEQLRQSVITGVNK